AAGGSTPEVPGAPSTSGPTRSAYAPPARAPEPGAPTVPSNIWYTPPLARGTLPPSSDVLARRYGPPDCARAGAASTGHTEAPSTTTQRLTGMRMPPPFRRGSRGGCYRVRITVLRLVTSPALSRRN